MASWKGKQRVLTVLARLPPALKVAIQETLEEEVVELVDAMKRVCPVGSELEHNPGQLRDSIHAYDGQRALRSGGVRTALLKSVTADAKDLKGFFIAPPVEFGHMTKDGGHHVPAHPFFFPTWRARRPGLKRRMAAKARAACHAIAGDWAK